MIDTVNILVAAYVLIIVDSPDGMNITRISCIVNTVNAVEVIHMVVNVHF